MSWLHGVTNHEDVYVPGYFLKASWRVPASFCEDRSINGLKIYKYDCEVSLLSLRHKQRKYVCNNLTLYLIGGGC